MQKRTICILTIFIVCIIPAVLAAEDATPAGNGTSMRNHMLTTLEEKGIDTTELKQAMESGDKEKEHAILSQYKDLLPAREGAGSPGPQGFSDNLLTTLKEKGIDTTELEQAIQSGDKEKERSIMDQYRDLIPRPAQNGTPREQHPGDGTDSSAQGAQKSSESPSPSSEKSPISLAVILGGLGAVALGYNARNR
ncbi:MAG TPA: hypothetical protein VN372_08875 [Methanospirillum sp.]|nr:hypothetical protein [Methanospirillum sp.]